MTRSLKFLSPFGTRFSTAVRRMLWIGLAIWLAWFRLPMLLQTYRYPTGVNRNFICDFFQDYASARNVLEGRPAYTDQNAVARKYVGRQVYLQTFQVNAHPPSSIPIFLPLALVGFPAAFAAWVFLSAAAVLAALSIVRRGLARHAGWWIW